MSGWAGERAGPSSVPLVRAWGSVLAGASGVPAAADGHSLLSLPCDGGAGAPVHRAVPEDEVARVMPRRKRYVRLHLEGMDSSVEGIFVGFWAGHYVLRESKVVSAVTGQRSAASTSLEGRSARFPKARVLFMQELNA